MTGPVSGGRFGPLLSSKKQRSFVVTTNALTSIKGFVVVLTLFAFGNLCFLLGSSVYVFNLVALALQ